MNASNSRKTAFIAVSLLAAASLHAGPAQLLQAARTGNLAAIVRELDAGTAIESCTEDGYTALSLAAHYGKAEALSLLLSRGAAIEVRQKDGYTPLIVACRRGMAEAARVLLKAGAAVDARDDDGYTALLSEADREGRLETVTLLCDSGADVNVPNAEGLSPLMRACHFGRSDIVEFLLDRGADRRQVDKKDRDAWWWASYGGSIAAVDLMRRAAGAPEMPLPAPSFSARSSGWAEGLHIHVFWYELADGKAKGTLSEHDFPAGVPYPTQVLRSLRSLNPLERVVEGADVHGTKAWRLSLEKPVELAGPRALYLGFAADVSLWEGLTWTYTGNEVPIPKTYPPEIASYLRASDVYDLDSPLILKERDAIMAGKPGSFEAIKRIWKIVYDRMDYGAVERPNTASQVLSWGKGRCGEFTSAFVALCRACGIPARGVWGLGEYPWLSDSDHAWPEVYVDGIGWIPCQPQTQPKEGFVFPVSFNRFYLMTRFSLETDAPKWDRPSLMQGKGLTKRQTPNGVGVFIELPAKERDAYVEIAASLIEDGRGAVDGALRTMEGMGRDARVFLLWLACGSSDEGAATRAATALVAEADALDGPRAADDMKTLRGKAMANLQQMLKETPTLARKRIEGAMGAFETD